LTVYYIETKLQLEVQLLRRVVYCEQTSVEWTLTAAVTVNVRWLLTSHIHNDNASVSRDGSETDAIKVLDCWCWRLFIHCVVCQCL